MRHLLSATGMFAICFFVSNSGPVEAATSNTWVAPNGTNSGACSISAPCKTFQFALSQTVAGGVINVLSSGNFGAVTIDKSISIVGDGVEAAILFDASAPGITVNAPGGAVVLRGLTIEPLAGAKDGISFVAGAALQVHDCFIRKATHGIVFSPSSGTSELYVTDSVIANSTGIGIYVNPTGSAAAKVLLDRVSVENSLTGMLFSGTGTTGAIVATVRDSVASGNTNGIAGQDSGTGSTKVVIDRSASVNNSVVGIKASNTLTNIRVGDSTVAGNATGLSAVGSFLISFGTNKMYGNGSDGAFTATTTYK